MTASEAGQLLLEALVFGKGGDILVLEMGEPVKIVDLTGNLIELSGLQPEQDIRIGLSGARPGEKLLAELNLQGENLTSTAHPRIRSFTQPAYAGKA